MPCKIEIKSRITNIVEVRTLPGLSMSSSNANKLAKEINVEFGENVVSFYLQGDYITRDIEIPKSLIDEYFDSEKIKEENEARDVQREDAERAGIEYTDKYLFFQQPLSELSKFKTIFKQEVVEWVKGKLSKDHIFDLGRPSGILQKMGFPDLPIILSKDFFENFISSKHPEIQKLDLYDLMEAIHNPVFVSNDNIHSGNVAVWTYLTPRDGKGKILVAISLKDRLGRQEVNSIRSIYSLKGIGYLHQYIDTLLNKNNLKYAQKSKALEYLKDIESFIESQRVASTSKKSGVTPSIFALENLKAKIQKLSEKVKSFSNPVSDEEIRFQSESLNASKSSEDTLIKVKEVIKKMGVNLQSLSDYLKENPNVEAKGVNALADIVKGIIAVAEGKEDVALTEEMVHVATAILEQKNPILIAEMISKIERFGIYKQTLNAYKDDVNYQTKDGKPDIRKIKKEAVDKLITELIIKGNEGSTEFPDLMDETNKSVIQVWWQKILDWFRGQYKASNISIFDEAAKIVMNEELGIVENVKQNQIYLSNEFSKVQPEKTYTRGEGINIPAKFRVLWSETTNKDSFISNRQIYNSVGYYSDSSILGEVNWSSLRKMYEMRHSLSDMERAQLFRDMFISLTRSTYGNIFNRGLATHLGLDRFTIVSLPTKSPLMAGKDTIYININENSSFINHLFDNAKDGNEQDLLDTMISEELIHMTSIRLSTQEEEEKAYRELSDEDKLKILQTYYHDINEVDTSKMNPHDYVHEYVRMQIQKKVLGWTTEEKRTTLAKIIDKVWDYLKVLLPKYTSLKSIYDKTLNFIEEGKGELNENSSNEILGLAPLSNKQKKIQQAILETQQRIRNVEAKEEVDAILRDTEEANNWYELLLPDGTWERIKKRVTDRVKEFYAKTFPHKEFTKEEKELNEIKRDAGVKYHNFFKLIHGMYFNSDGTKLDKVGERPVIDNDIDEQVFMKLERYFVNLMKSRFTNDKSPLVFSEVKIYDPIKKEAGTLDLLIIDESGKAHVLDWKFMNLAAGATDIAWFKKGAFNIQLGRYKEILKDVYGVKEMGMIRAIPILMKMERIDAKKKDSLLHISGINIGSVNPDNIETLTLLPIAERSESIESILEDKAYKPLDKLIEKLNNVAEQIGSNKVTGEEAKQYKTRRLNILNQAIRSMQIQQELAPLIDVIKEIAKEGQIIIDDYTLNFKDRSANSPELTEEVKSKMASDMREYIAIAKVFSNITVSVGHLIYNEKMIKSAKTDEEKEEVAERKQHLSDIRTEQDNINRSLNEIEELSGEFANKYIGWANRVIDLLLPEKVVKGLAATFKGVSDLPTAALRILYTLTTNAKMTASRTAFEEVEKLIVIREKLKAKGNLRDIIKQIYQRDDKNKLINKLVYRYSKEFFTQVDDNAVEGRRNKKWIKENIDYEAYKKEVKETLKRRIEWIIKKHSTVDEKITEQSIEDKLDSDKSLTENEKLIHKLITDERRMFDIDRKDFYGWNNYIIKRHPLEKWLSEEYKNIAKDADLLELYEFIVKTNDHAKDVGYIDNKNKSSFFLPFVRKTMAESFAWDFDISAIKNWGESFSINPSTTGYGSVNELSEQIEHSIPRYFTYDFTLEDGKRDTSDLSEDLFKNMIAYITHLQKYTYLTKVEDQIKLIKDIEAGKKHLVTTAANTLAIENGEPVTEKGNDENAELFDKFMRGIFYEEKYPVSDTDVAINANLINQMKGLINKMAGKEVYKINENPSAISMVKTIDAANRAFQLKTLGFEAISGLVNAFGGRIQVATQAGNYFKSSEIDRNAMKLVQNKFANDDEREIFIQLIDRFMPMKDDPSYEEMKKAGLSPFTRGSFIDTLMVFMRFPEQCLEKSVFLSLLDNMMIVDGKIVSIPEHVRNQYKGKDDQGRAYVQAQDTIKKEIEDLKKTSSISATVSLVDGKLNIPGLDMSDHNELNRLTRLTRRISRKATGGVSDSDRNQASMSIWLNSMMVFKSWIPKLLATRFDHFQQVSDDFSVIVGEDGTTEGEKYDIGRVRLWWGFMGFNLIKSIQDITNVLYAKEHGMEKLDELFIKYTKQYKERTGKDLTMSREDFIDMVRTNLRNQMKEIAILMSLVGAGLVMGFMKPPDDADKATKNFFRYAQKTIDKFVQELSFFYNPLEFQRLLSGGMFPAIGIFNDIEKFVTHFFMETTGLDLSNRDLTQEEVYKKAQPIKYLGKMFPISKSVFTYGAILNTDFAKEYDVTIPKEANR